MVYVVYIVSFILYSWFLFKSGKKHAENKDTIKLVITGKPEQVKEAIKTINEQNYLLK
ncbi:transcriptional regulator [Lactococcus phage CHPC972]|uniref:Transcriptional regulator n=2 Tax=Ceduovirus TaxID=186532 RepID=A0A650ETS9_9CAUD|nr:transcriptional regulator [Lactococcus phage CHPC116]YP_010081225.1 transcriptional regulator [Lactococcus phage CHPC972]QGT52488.1 transcriptional regulator [Lactococcus phage CHPC116]QGT53480.1 transcriptional regulator [Lactococcus phage CHPC972]